MKQELYKNMYDQICMGEEQKNRIWQNLETKERKKYFPVRAAVCAGVLLISGMTAFAANELSVMNRIADAMGFFTKNEQELTQEQKNIYAQYGSALDNEITMTYGTLKLDAVLYDEKYLFVPFRYIYNQNMEGYEELKAGTDIRKTSLWKAGKPAGYAQDMDAVDYCIMQDTMERGFITMFDPMIEEDGILSGSILLFAGLDGAFTKGAVIQAVGRQQADGKTGEVEVLSEFSLEKPVEQRELAVTAENSQDLERMGLTIENLLISPISLQYSGIGTHRDVLQVSVEVILKDGRAVEESASGSYVGFDGSAAEKEPASYSAQKLFAEPVLPEEIAGVRVKNKTQEVWIAVE